MDLQQIARFHNERNRLFQRRDGSQLILDAATYETMADQLPGMDHERSMAALVRYRERRPYKGFYWEGFMAEYGRDGTGAPASRAPARAPEDLTAALDAAAKREQANELEDFDALPPEFVAECAKRYADWGIPARRVERSWRILCIDAYNGRDVEPYRIHHRRELVRRVNAREEMDRQSMIEQLRMEIWRLEAENEHLARPSDLPL